VVGVVHKEINLSSPLGIIHSHLIVLVRHKQAQMFLQSDPKRYAENWLQLELRSFGKNA